MRDGGLTLRDVKKELETGTQQEQNLVQKHILSLAVGLIISNNRDGNGGSKAETRKLAINEEAIRHLEIGSSSLSAFQSLAPRNQERSAVVAYVDQVQTTLDAVVESWKNGTLTSDAACEQAGKIEGHLKNAFEAIRRQPENFTDTQVEKLNEATQAISNAAKEMGVEIPSSYPQLHVEFPSQPTNEVENTARAMAATKSLQYAFGFLSLSWAMYGYGASPTKSVTRAVRRELQVAGK